MAYRGVLRGAEGVLADRDGNALDRALLLQRLLTVAGHRARLASGTLDTANATQLASNSELSASRFPFSAIEITDTRASNARSRVINQSEHIMQLLGNSPSGEREKAAVVADIADHWWVQVQNDGQWLDLDTLATGPEKSLTEATTTFTEETLPKELYQQVSVRLLLETR